MIFGRLHNLRRMVQVHTLLVLALPLTSSLFISGPLGFFLCPTLGISLSFRPPRLFSLACRLALGFLQLCFRGCSGRRFRLLALDSQILL